VEKNKNNDSRIDTDNLNLKDHLNASFDNDKITVSEDLIARTLKAVKESENQEVKVGQKNEIKKKQFPVRQVASAAAVIVLLLVGMNVLQNGFPKNSKEDTRIASDSATTETAPNEILTAKDNALADLNESNEESLEIYTYDEKTMEGTTEPEAGTVTDNASSNLTAAEAPSAEQDVGKDGGGVSDSYTENHFTSLYPFTTEDAELFTVTTKTQDILTIDVSKVKEFYTILDGFTLTQMDNDIKDTWDYKVEIKTTNQTYTILLGNGIQVIENEDSFVYYAIDDYKSLIEQVDLFLK
jgi:hypothetical protein